MPRTEVQFRLVFCVLASLFIAACSSNKEDIDNTPDINTFNIFIENIDPPGPGAESAAYSYHPETQTLRERARFYQGENLHLEMDTNRDKQGFEYLAFVAEDDLDPSISAVYLLNYDKDSRGRVTKLSAFPSEICGIYPIYTRSSQVIEEQSPLDSTQVNDTVLEIHTASVGFPTCDASTNLAYELDFDTDDLDSTQVKIKNYIERAFITDFNGRDDNNVRGIVYHLVDNNKGQLSLIDSDDTTLWTVELPAGAQRIYAAQVTTSDVLLQTNNRVYVRNIVDLITAANNDDATPTPTPLQERVFGPSYLELVNSDESNPITWTTSSVSDGKRLLVHEAGFFEEIYEVSAAASDYQVFEVRNEEYLVIESEAGQERLIRLTNDGASWNASQALLNSQNADEIIVHYDQSSYYISALNLGGIIDGWTSIQTEHYQTQENTYPNTVFVATKQFSTDPAEIYILQSQDSSAAGELINPELFSYDVDRPDGRKLRTDSNGEIIQQNNIAQAVTFGEVSGLVSSLSSTPIQINDSFARIGLLFDDLSTGQFYFDPSETDDESLASVQVTN